MLPSVFKGDAELFSRERAPGLVLGITVLACLGATACASEGYANKQTAEIIKQRDEGHCPVGDKVRFGGLLANGISSEVIIAAYVGKDEARTEELYRIRSGVGNQDFLIRRPVELPHGRYGQFSSDKVIVAGEIEMGKNAQGQDECLLYAAEMYKASQPSQTPSPSTTP